MIFQTAWWTVDLPPHWQGRSDPECATFQASPPMGALQISVACKDDGIVTDADLSEFADERSTQGVHLEPVNYGILSGFTAKFSNERSIQFSICAPMWGRLKICPT